MGHFAIAFFRENNVNVELNQIFMLISLVQSVWCVSFQ